MATLTKIKKRARSHSDPRNSFRENSVCLKHFDSLVVLMMDGVCFYQVYSSLDLSRGLLEEKGEAEGKKSESPLTLDSLSWTPDFAEMYVLCFLAANLP